MGYNAATWGNAAEWVAGVGTVGALGFTYRLLRHELQLGREARAEADARQELRQFEQREREAEQAGCVSSWVEHQEYGPGGRPVVLFVRNASKSPIYNCLAEVSEVLGERRDSGTWHPVPPETTVQLKLIRPTWNDLADDADLNTQVRFTDSHGRHWQRNWYGQLERLERGVRNC